MIYFISFIILEYFIYIYCILKTIKEQKFSSNNFIDNMKIYSRSEVVKNQFNSINFIMFLIILPFFSILSIYFVIDNLIEFFIKKWKN